MYRYKRSQQRLSSSSSTQVSQNSSLATKIDEKTNRKEDNYKKEENISDRDLDIMDRKPPTKPTIPFNNIEQNFTHKNYNLLKIW